ncbi:MAG: tetratricopeptide repeat protein, partial [Acidobacteria bacterium]|nr:tetratricopeptide repeat protein [Acidobacteriota bacterium]
NGEILVNHQIIFESKDQDRTLKIKTNKKGEFIHVGIPPGTYDVELWSPEGAKLFGMGSVRLTTGKRQLDFDLAQERKIQEGNPEYLAAVKKQQEAQAKSTKEFSSLKEHFEAGNLYLQQKNYDQAITHFEAALEMAKLRNLPVIVARIADAYAAAGKYEEAEKSYKQAIELRPEAASVHSNFALALAKMGRVDEARVEFDKASELNPETAAVNYFNLGAILYNQGTQMEEAEAAFKKCLELNPKHADAHFLTAQAMMGKLTLDPETGATVPPEGLIEALQTYLELEPEGKYAGNAKMLIQTMAGTIETNFKAAPRRRRRGN